MKYTIKQTLTILCLLVATGINAQTIDRKVINTMGGTLAPSGGPQLTHNVGETFSTTLTAGGYSLTQGFLQPLIVTVPPITGTLTVCVGATTTLSDSMSGGTWSSSNTSVATVGSTGIVTGVAAGTSTISFIVSGSSATAVVTVTALPDAGSISIAAGGLSIGQNYGGGKVAYILQAGDPGYDASLQKGLVVASNDQSDGLYWGCCCSSGPAIVVGTMPNIGSGATNTASIVSICGPGTAAYTCDTLTLGGYTDWYLPSQDEIDKLYLNQAIIGGFSNARYWSSTELVSAALAMSRNIVAGDGGIDGKDLLYHVRAIRSFSGGLSQICVGNTMSLSNYVAGGTWSSSNSSVATVGSTGVVTGIASGTTTISYTVINACGSGVTTKVVTVNPTPSAGTITGPSAVCAGSTITLSNTTTGGAWSSSNTSKATVGSTGIVTGVANGTVTISYTLTNSCGTATATKGVTVNGTSAVISTIAGNGASAYSGDGGLALSSGIDPIDVVTDGSGNFYFTDNNNSRIRKVSPSGIISTIAGNGTAGYGGDGGPATAAMINSPVGIAIDSVGNIYFADVVNQRVRKISTFGTISTVAGTGVAGYSGDGGPATSAQISYPRNIAIDKFGNVYFTEAGTFIIRKINTAGIISTIAGNGTASYTGDGGPASAASLNYPWGITVDTLLNLYFTEVNAGRIRKISSSGVINTIAGTGAYSYAGDGGNALSASFRTPYNIKLDQLGNIYFSDVNSQCIRKIDTANIITTFTGNGTPGFLGDGGSPSSAIIRNPHGIAITSSNEFYFCDRGNNRIRKISPSGTVVVAPISGLSSVCVGSAVTLSDSTTGGSWSSSNVSIATVGSTGIVTGVSAGTVTISYTVSNSCGTATATKVLTVNAVSGGIPTSGLIAWYPFNGNANDESGNGNNGTNYGATLTADRFGNSGKSFDFNGAGNYVQTSFQFPTGSSAKSMSVWFLIDSLKRGWIIGGGVDIDAQAFGLALKEPGTDLFFHGNSIYDRYDPVAYSSGNWNHVVVTLANDTLRIYRNGTKVVDTIDYLSTSSSNMLIGRRINASIESGFDAFFAGKIDDIAIYNRALTTSEITQLYNAGIVAGTITGSSSVCTGSTITLSDTIAGGTWSSSNTSVAIVGSTGIVSGVASGSATISYAVTNACGSGVATKVVTVNGTPSAGTITGSSAVCAGSTTTLSNATTGGSWTSSNTAIATVGATGVVTGVSGGTVTISYTVSNSCGTATATKVITVNAVSGGIPTSGLIAWYPFNGNANDESGNGHHGIITGTITSVSDRFGNIGSSYLFDGTTGYISVPTLDTLKYRPITYSAWVVVNSYFPSPTVGHKFRSIVGRNTAYILNNGVLGFYADGSSFGSYGAYDNTFLMWRGGGVTSDTPSSNYVPLLNTWVHVVYTQTDSGNWRFYTNGTLTNSGFFNDSQSDFHYFRIGGCNNFSDGNTLWNDRLDDIAIYNRALSPSEVSQLYNAGNVAGTITGPSSVYVGATITLSDSTAGGTWSSSNTSIATVGSTGVVTGVAPGTVTISYTVSNACGSAVATKVVTVNSAISSPITGTFTTCIGATTTLSNTTTGGTWSSSTPAVAIIGSASGIVTGVSAGTSTITYTVGGSYVTAVVTVYTMPAAITGGGSACAGATITLACTTTGGSWSSSNTSAATVGSTGIVTGVATGTSVISYTVSGACSSTKTITINALPSAIGGTLNGCIAMTNTLTCTPSGGAWSSSTPSVANINSSGQATGYAAGTTTITYGLSTGCRSTAVLTINALPDSVSGVATVCPGLTTTFTGYPSGGNWASSNTAAATVDASGIITGVALGTSRITYSNASGCYKTKIVTVNAAPTAITGTAAVCVAATTTLACAGGGTWTSGNTSVATIGSTTGVVTGVSAGTTIITYRLSTGCINTRVVTVNNAPAAITGTANICAGTTTTLSSTTTGGTWSSSILSVATVGSGTGVVTGVTGGASTISYTIAGGCRVTKVVTVNNNPPAIGGSTTLTTGGTTTLTNSLSGGSWSSGSTAVATVGSTGLVYGVGAGTAVISYTASTGCYITKTVTVSGTIGGITGSTSICAGTTSMLSCTPSGGVWSSTNASVATITSGGLVTGVSAGTATMIYTISGTSTSTVVSVYPMPAAISGPGGVCIGSSSTLSNTVSGGSWSSSNTSVATIGSTGIVSGVAAGTTTISYQTGTGCGVARVVTVNALPAAISGPASVCVGSSGTLTCTTTGGAWSSSDISVANIDAGGNYTGYVAGTVTMSYTIASGCSSVKILTVNAIPGAITGTMALCVGDNTTLASSPSGGTWSSGNTSVATINSSGVVTAVSSGITTITYNTGCSVTASLTVNAAPTAIGGSLSLCVGSNTTLTNASGGGTWSSSNSAVGTISSPYGTLTGLAPGTTTITYSVGTGCYITAVATVNNVPGSIGGTLSLCASGGTTTLTCTPSGGTWSASTPATATVNSTTGVVTGATAGTVFVTYTTGSGCFMVATVTVNPLPAAITGNSQMCPGTTSTLSSATTGGSWSSTNTGVATISSTGTVTAVAVGTTIISYTVGTCAISKQMTVNTSITADTSFNVCLGSTVTLVDSLAGGTWTSANPSIATVVSSSGLATGVAAGSVMVTYSVGGTCTKRIPLYVHNRLTTISGTGTICEGTGTSLSVPSLHMGGAWSSGSPTVATVNASTGMLTGVSGGTVTISYTLVTCVSTRVFTINPKPATITGTKFVCTGTTATLSSATSGGTWSSGNTAVATVGSTGVTTGVAPGGANISYTLPTGCYRNVVVTVAASPATISGTTNVCTGNTITMTNTSAGGTWSSSNTSVATIDGGGVVSGLTPGTTTISYGYGGTCASIKTVTVNASPGVISGPDVLCAMLTVTMTNSLSGGTWSSSTTAVGTINVTTGVFTGAAAGSVNVTYKVAGNCISVKPVTVNATPAAITGSSTVVVGTSTTLASTTSGGTWSSSNTAVGTVVGSTGVVTGVSAGTTNISYTLGSGCFAVKGMTVNPAPLSKPGSGLMAGSEVSFSVYPNPNQGTLTIEAAVSGVFRIYTVDSRLVKEHNISAPFTVIQLPQDLASGVYMCRFTGVDGSTETVRLVYQQ